ncbi:UDP-N-acetylmuramate dehydrogenase [candidate division WOR-3 bacterium]|nr:UDP-N-acetylmuramate dehydrogenase [candidate division WOR-3 bacterium]
MKDPFKGMMGIKILKDEPLSKHTSFHIGGDAKFFIRVCSIKALKKVLQIAMKNKMRYFVIGSGTNLLVSDKGFPDVVIKLNGIFTKIKRERDLFCCGGGVLIDRLLMKAGRLAYGGAEFLAGIPGTVGGGIKGNAGAFGRSFAEIVDKITIINHRIMEQDLYNNDIGFAYRSSKLKNGTIIISAKIRFTRGRQKDIMAIIKRNLKYRRQRQPAGYSAGSFFKNPLPYSAGKLIEECGLKGLRVGDAEVSMKHANFIINRGKARTSDVIKLAKRIQKIVRNKKGILLKQEVKTLS